MSDMSRPPTMPPAPDHERHDALLVAQFVAGDPLAPEQRAAAERLVGGCGACAALAADLPAISRAVAQEPVPPRRRDFRLAPEQAEELRGNALTRALRRLSLPSSRAFQPAAAGVLTIGLLFVVAGYAWPDGGTIDLQSAPAPVEQGTLQPSAETFEAPPAVVESDADAGPALEGAERAMEDPAFAGSLAESQAGLSEEPMQKSLTEDEDARRKAAAPELPAADELQTAPEPETQQRLVQSSPPLEGTGLGAAAITDEGSAGDTTFRDRAQSDEATGTTVPADLTPNVADDGDGSALIAKSDVLEPGAEVPEAEAAMAVDDGGPEDLLLILGLVLALGGGGLLLLGWLARRARDPLAP